ncbi:hypothetical protein HY488_02530 [Candidatus Woesearchaeota archaeon]|nr:hypothetical protein [Candidatus Woesearchaeota archaeon]
MTDDNYLEHAKEELKRVDHLIYVSLKYTRTCDIFKNIIERLISALEFGLDAILQRLEEEKRIFETPSQPGAKCNAIKEHVKDEHILQLVEFYLLLRQMNRADFSREREYRRHVTMTMTIEGKPIEVNIDNITQYYKDAKVYIEHIEGYLKGTS